MTWLGMNDKWLVDPHLSNYLRTSLIIRWDRPLEEFIEVLDAELNYLRKELLMAYDNQTADLEEAK